MKQATFKLFDRIPETAPAVSNNIFFKKGYSDASSCGSGWEQYAKGSKLTLIVEIDGQRHEIWLTPFFHGYYDRLTTKVRNVIEQTRPDFIDAVEQTRQDGQCYFTASDADFAAWLERVRSILGR